jgi:hypothetical protein
MIFDDCRDPRQVLRAQPVVPSEFDGWLEPEFRLAVAGLHVDMNAGLLAREKEEPERSFPEDSRAHTVTGLIQPQRRKPPGCDLHPELQRRPDTGVFSEL